MTRLFPLDTDSPELRHVGGKARSLARLIRAGFAVPDGFVIGTEAYRGFIEEHRLGARIVDLAVPEVVDGELSFEGASAEIRRLFGQYALPTALQHEIAAAIDAHGGLGETIAVAVRSSATAEDLADFSFAGQQESYLNVRGRDRLFTAVRDCWASLWTARAMAYRFSTAAPQEAVAMAVVVQAMVPAEAAGVLFTANPVTGDRAEMLVDANHGLGESIVSGQVTPDTFVVDRESLAIKERVLGSKAFKIVADTNGTRTVALDPAERDAPAIPDDALRTLAETALRVEALNHGVPQDIEWAVAEGQVWLLQSRPITNLPPAPIADPSWNPPPSMRALMRRQVVEMMPEPLSPLFEGLYFEGQDIGNRVYQEHADFPFRIDGPWYVTVNGFGYSRADVSMRAKHRDEGAQTPWAVRRNRLALWWMNTLSKSAVGRFVNGRRQVADWRRRILPRYLGVIDNWRDADPRAESAERLYAGIRELTIADAVYWASGTSKVFGAAKLADQELQNFLAERSALTSGEFLTGFDTITMRSNHALWRIARAIRVERSVYELVVRTPERRLIEALRDHPQGHTIAARLDAHLAAYGHQIHNLDYVVPTQREDPRALLVNLKSMVLDETYDPDARQAQMHARRRDAMREARGCMGVADYLRFRWRLFAASHFYPAREETAFYMGKAWPVLRPLALELGGRLVAADSVEDDADVFHLRVDELEDDIARLARGERLPDRRGAVAERRELREARKRLQPPSVIPPEAADELRGRAAAVTNEADASTLAGFAVSPGTVTGPVSVIRSPAEFADMRRNTILVCPMTTPAWTQLFSRASGLVTDIGGITAHGSIVAREYGIPAVLGTGDITARVQSGDRVTIDGGAGTVVIHDPVRLA